MTERIEQIMGRGNGCSIPVHKEITTAIVETFSYQRTVNEWHAMSADCVHSSSIW